MGHDDIRITITLPNALLAGLDTVVHAGAAPSRSAFIADAVRQALAASERAAIDAAFAAMAKDDEYQREALRIASEFEPASSEALAMDLPTP